MLSTQTQLLARYEAMRADPLVLDLTRGDPPLEAVRLAVPMLGHEHVSRDGVDCLTYSRPKYFRGLPEARELYGSYLGVPTERVFIGGNSSLMMMCDMIGLMVPRSPFVHKIIVVEPGYDRHIEIPELYGAEPISVPMLEDGPDMDRVERLVRDDPSVIGIICVPKYSNPTAETYSTEKCRRLAQMKTAYEKFRIVWDLAYQGHHLAFPPERELPDMLTLCREAGHADRVLIFGSTSKIDFASAGLALFAASENNLAAYEAWLRKRTIGENKLPQLQRVQYFKDLEGIRAHMAKHRAILKPKFDLLDSILERELSGLEGIRWTKPAGGYFTCLWVPGKARRVVELSAEMRLLLTLAGSGFINRHDPENALLRLAPTFPPLSELEQKLPAIPIAVRMALAE